MRILQHVREAWDANARWALIFLLQVFAPGVFTGAAITYWLTRGE